MLTQSSFFKTSLIAASLLLASAAGAVQFTPTLTARLHTLTSGQPGAEWNTGANGAAGGQLVYSSGTQQLTLAAGLDVLNYYDAGPCPTDVGSNCSFNYATDPSINVTANLDGIVVTNLGGGFFQMDINFASTGGNDITVIDTTDNTVLLTASWQAGTFQGFPTTGLTVSGIYDSNTASLIGDPTALGFAEITGGLYASLFDSGGATDISLHLAEFFNFVPTTSAIAGAIAANYTLNGGAFVDDSALINFTADGQGQVFRVADGDFEAPEAGGVGLAAAALALLAVRRRAA